VRLLFFDLETTGLDPEKDLIIEGAGVLWETGINTYVKMFSTLVYDEHKTPVLDPVIVVKTGITNDMLKHYGVTYERFAKAMYSLVEIADGVVAHNGTAFDFLFIKAEFARNGLHLNENKIYVDTKTDLPYPDSITTRNLVHLAAEHGFVNPFPHRALPDTLTMQHLFAQYPLDEVLALAQEPLETVVAKVEFKNNKLAKERGYFWDSDNKQWRKELKRSRAIREIQEAPFSCFKF